MCVTEQEEFMCGGQFAQASHPICPVQLLLQAPLSHPTPAALPSVQSSYSHKLQSPHQPSAKQDSDTWHVPLGLSLVDLVTTHPFLSYWYSYLLLGVHAFLPRVAWLMPGGLEGDLRWFRIHSERSQMGTIPERNMHTQKHMRHMGITDNLLSIC